MRAQDLRHAAARAAFEVLDDVVLVVAVDPAADYPIVDANPAVRWTAGRERDEVVGRPLAAVQPPAAVRAFAGHVDEVLRTGHPSRYQVDHEAPAGHVTFEVTLCPLPGTGDDPPCVVAVLHDATALRRTSNTLAEVERVSRTGTWTWDVADDTVRWSGQLYDLFGLDREAFEPSLAGYLQRVHPDDRAALEAAIDHTHETGEPFELDHRVVTPTDEHRWLHCTGRRVDDLAGNPVRMSGTAQLVRTPDGPTAP